MTPHTPFDGKVTDKEQHGILFSLKNYLELVDHTGRIVRNDKRGAIALHASPILERLGIDQKAWLNNATAFEQIYRQRFAKKRNRKAEKSIA